MMKVDLRIETILLEEEDVVFFKKLLDALFLEYDNVMSLRYSVVF